MLGPVKNFLNSCRRNLRWLAQRRARRSERRRRHRRQSADNAERQRLLALVGDLRRGIEDDRVQRELDTNKLRAEADSARHEVKLLALVHERDRRRVEAEIGLYSSQLALESEGNQP